MKLHYLLLLMLISQSIYSQNNYFLKDFYLTDETKVICLTNYSDSLQLNKRFTFYCKDQNEVAKIFNSFKVGEKVKEIYDTNAVNLYVLKGKEILSFQMLINPLNSNVNTDVFGHYGYYSFDTTYLINANRKYPISYKAKWLTFDTKKEFKEFIEAHKNDTTLLCYQDNTHQYPGMGMIYYSNDKTTTTPQEAYKLLIKTFNKINSIDEAYLIGILLEKGNVMSFNYQIECSKLLFDKFDNPNYTKGEWMQNKYQLLTYWKE